MDIWNQVLDKNGLIFAFMVVGALILISQFISNNLLKNKIPAAALAILIGLILAFFGDKKGLADISMFSGLAILGGSMFRDFAVVATAIGADLKQIKQAGLAGVISLVVGVTFTFFMGATMAYFMGYTDSVSAATIGAGACTYIVGPVTGAALGASSDVIAISIASGVIKTIFTAIGTPLIAKRINLDNAHAAVVFGGLVGTTSGVVAGLAATDEKLVPYGAMTATFYTGLGCLLCPSIYFVLLSLLL
jgi:malonate transporter MadM subunit